MRMPISRKAYVKKLCKHSFKDTLIWFRWDELSHILRNIVIVCLGWFIIWKTEGSMVVGEEIGIGISFLAAIGTIFICVFFYNLLFAVPYQLVSYQFEKTATLEKVIEELKRKEEPQLMMEFDPIHNSSYLHVGRCTGGFFRLFRISLFNDSHTSVENAQIKLEQVHVSQELMGVLPFCLHFKDDNNPPYQKSVTIGPGDRVFVDVVQWIYNLNANSTPYFMFYSAIEGINTRIPVGTYTILLKVTGHNISPVFKKYLISIEGGQFEMKKINGEKSNNQETNS